VSELTNGRENRALHRSGTSLRPTKRKRVSLSWQISQKFLEWEAEYMPNVDGDNGAARAPYICSSSLYTMETRTMTWFNCACNRNWKISRLHTGAAQSWELHTVSRFRECAAHY